MNDIANYLTAILGRLCAAVGAFTAAQARGRQLVWLGTQAFAPLTQPNHARIPPPETWTLLTQRLTRLAQRFRALFARYQAGTLPLPRPSRAGQPRQRSPEPRLPAARGWIGAHIPAAAPCAGTIEHLLHNETEMREFVSQAPQAGRLLRPLARMLGLTLPDWLRLPPRAPKPRAPRTPAPAPTGTPDRPLQPEIRATARARKKYDR